MSFPGRADPLPGGLELAQLPEAPRLPTAQELRMQQIFADIMERQRELEAYQARVRSYEQTYRRVMPSLIGTMAGGRRQQLRHIRIWDSTPRVEGDPWVPERPVAEGTVAWDEYQSAVAGIRYSPEVLPDGNLAQEDRSRAYEITLDGDQYTRSYVQTLPERISLLPWVTVSEWAEGLPRPARRVATLCELAEAAVCSAASPPATNGDGRAGPPAPPGAEGGPTTPWQMSFALRLAR
ncbi:hypothetical protein RJ55_00148 [Drechmeria coniospora]|nr:hypothetical protein RJ55_00148 [Drechmeria coniospora]